MTYCSFLPYACWNKSSLKTLEYHREGADNGLNSRKAFGILISHSQAHFAQKMKIILNIHQMILF